MGLKYVENDPRFEGTQPAEGNRKLSFNLVDTM